jgi:hypothetical protein
MPLATVYILSIDMCSGAMTYNGSLLLIAYRTAHCDRLRLDLYLSDKLWIDLPGLTPGRIKAHVLVLF